MRVQLQAAADEIEAEFEKCHRIRGSSFCKNSSMYTMGLHMPAPTHLNNAKTCRF